MCNFMYFFYLVFSFMCIEAITQLLFYFLYGKCSDICIILKQYTFIYTFFCDGQN